MNADKTKRSRCLLIRVHLRSSAAIHCFFLMTLENPVAAHQPVPPRAPAPGSELNTKLPHPGDPETMPKPRRSTRKGSQMSRLDRAMAALAEVQARTAANKTELNSAMDALAEAETKTDAIMARLGRTMKRLAEAQSETDADLSNLSPETRSLGRQLLAYLNRSEEHTSEL